METTLKQIADNISEGIDQINDADSDLDTAKDSALSEVEELAAKIDEIAEAALDIQKVGDRIHRATACAREMDVDHLRRVARAIRGEL